MWRGAPACKKCSERELLWILNLRSSQVIECFFGVYRRSIDTRTATAYPFRPIRAGSFFHATDDLISNRNVCHLRYFWDINHFHPTRGRRRGVVCRRDFGVRNGLCGLWAGCGAHRDSQEGCGHYKSSTHDPSRVNLNNSCCQAGPALSLRE